MDTPGSLRWDPERLRRALGPLLPGLEVDVRAECGSTSTELLDRARRPGAGPCLLVAERQTGGRGRMGRPWLSSPGASLTFSLALPLAPADWSGLSLAVGLALAEALDPAADGSAPRLGLKWPNDLALADAGGRQRQHGGLLGETVGAGSGRTVVVGIGLNVLPQHWEGLAQPAACLGELDPALGAPEALQRVAGPLVRALLRFEREGFAPCAARYARRDLLRGRPVTTTAPAPAEGLADGVDADGALLVRPQPGAPAVRVLRGEVSVRLRAAGDLAARAAQGAPHPDVQTAGPR
ncbi:MAG: biotin--[acetyl-CoA-carboxylase] ligase [Pseudomonadota bacterium]